MSEITHRPNNDGLTPIQYNYKPNVRTLQADVDQLKRQDDELAAQLAEKATKDYVDTQVRTIPKGDKGEKGEPGTASVAIDDTVTNTSQTWSGKKINELLNNIAPENTTFSKTGKNLLNKNKATQGKMFEYLTTNIVNHADYYLSDYIEVEPNAKYTCTYMYGYAYYDSGFNPIVGLSPNPLGSTHTITIPAGAKYIRINIYKTRINIMQFEKGERATAYEDYYALIDGKMIDTSDFSIDRDSFSESLLESSVIGYGKAKFANVEWVKGYISDGVFSSDPTSPRVGSQNLMKFESEAKIVLKNSDYRYVLYELDANGVFIAGTGWLTNKERLIPYDPNKRYRIALARKDESVNLPLSDLIKNITIVEGDVNLSADIFGDSVKKVLKKNNSFDLFGNKKRYVSIAGIAGQGMSNCIEAIVQSAHAGIDSVEVDVRLSKDNNVILAHNEDISTFTNAPAGTKVSDKTTAELKEYIHTADYVSYSYYDDIRLATLSECIDACKKYGLLLMIDIKSDGYESTRQELFVDKIIDICIEKGIQNQCVFVSLQQPTRLYIRSKLPFAHIALKKAIWNTSFEQDIAQVNEIGGNVIMQPEEKDGNSADLPVTLTPERVRKYHEYNLPIKEIDWVMTNELKGIRKSGVHYTFVFTTPDNGATWTLNKRWSNEEGSLVETTLTKKEGYYLFKCKTLFPLLLENLRPSVSVMSNNPSIQFGYGFTVARDGGLKLYPSADINSIQMSELTINLDF